MGAVKKVKAYVDGSYNSKNNSYGGGVVVYLDDYETPIEQKITGNDNNFARLRNVAGEILAALAALELAEKFGAKNLLIYYDYSGIELWTVDVLNGGWRAKQRLTQAYQYRMNKAREDGLCIEFCHVNAHTGDVGNERADKLAKEACKS